MHNIHPPSGNRFDHVGILVEDFADLRRVLGDLLGAAVEEPVAAPDLGIEIMWIELGGVAFELIRPLHEEARAAAVLRAGEGGVHHVAVTVDDIDATLLRARQRGIEVADEQPRAGVHGSRIAFLAAESASGALVELVEKPSRP